MRDSYSVSDYYDLFRIFTEVKKEGNYEGEGSGLQGGGDENRAKKDTITDVFSHD